MMRTNLCRRPFGLGLTLAGLLVLIGCYNTPSYQPADSRGAAPLREQSPAGGADCCYEDSVEAGHLFKVYCSACHNARPLSERPFSNYQNVMTHMRVRANLTGKEAAKLMAWLRRWHDVPPPGKPETPSPTRFYYSQPIPELREQKNKTAPDLPGGPRAGSTHESSPGQPAVGTGPQEGR